MLFSRLSVAESNLMCLDWNHNTLVLGEKGKKNTFAVR